MEGIADFFSSHVYDSETGRLTVNVLDRAPIHNHLVAGLEKWEELGKPSFSELYEKGDISRGINVLLTAFLQSTPEYEQNWSLYVRGVVANRDATRAKDVSGKLLHDLYGAPKTLDAPFAKWIEGLRPSYQIFSRDFDQDGDSLVSDYPASQEAPARIILPALGASSGPFARDWPSSGTDGNSSATTLFQTTIQAEVPPPGKEHVEIALCDSKGEPLLQCRIRSAIGEGMKPGIKVQEETPRVVLSVPPRSWAKGMTIDFSRSSDPDRPIDILLTTQDSLPLAANPALPVSIAKRLAETDALRPQFFATVPGIRFSLQNQSSFALPRLSADHRASPSRKNTLGRFDTPSAFSRIFRAIRHLGKNAPLPLRFARNDLLSENQGTENALVTDEVLATATYWESLARAIAGSRASTEEKTAALIDLAHIRLAAGPSPDGTEVTL